MPRCRAWSSVPSNLWLANNEVHVWCVDLSALELDTNSLRLNLPEDENAKADTFHFQNDRENYIARHAMLRNILGRYVSLESEHIRLSYSSHGKPSLADYHHNHRIRFSLSHSKGVVLYAITRGREVGVDVERIVPNIMDEQFVAYVFSHKERSAIQSLPSELRRNASFQSWTRKEAYGKALGRGLDYNLKQLNVSNAFCERNLLSNRNNDAHDIRCWTIRDLELGPGYAGSIVAEGHDWAFQCWKLENDF